MDFGAGNAEICKFGALILHSPHKVHHKSYQGKGFLSSHGKVCVEVEMLRG